MLLEDLEIIFKGHLFVSLQNTSQKGVSTLENFWRKRL